MLFDKTYPLLHLSRVPRSPRCVCVFTIEIELHRQFILKEEKGSLKEAEEFSTYLCRFCRHFYVYSKEMERKQTVNTLKK